jgi:hypothetical protein
VCSTHNYVPELQRENHARQVNRRGRFNGRSIQISRVIDKDRCRTKFAAKGRLRNNIGACIVSRPSLPGLSRAPEEKPKREAAFGPLRNRSSPRTEYKPLDDGTADNPSRSP